MKGFSIYLRCVHDSHFEYFGFVLIRIQEKELTEKKRNEEWKMHPNQAAILMRRSVFHKWHYFDYGFSWSFNEHSHWMMFIVSSYPGLECKLCAQKDLKWMENEITQSTSTWMRWRGKMSQLFEFFFCFLVLFHSFHFVLKCYLCIELN